MSAHASGASNGSTSSSPFFATQSSNLFGTAVGNSNGASGALCGCTSASPFFATQNSNSFESTAVGNSNGASGASNVSTFTSPFCATQSSNAFGSGADISNGGFGAWNNYTSAYGVIPNQSSKPFGFGTAPSTTSAFSERSPSSTWLGFGCPTGTNTSPFVQSSSSFPGFGGDRTNASTFGQTTSSFGGFGEAAKTSPFGQTPSNFGGFGEATTSTTPLSGDTTSSISTFRGEPLFRLPRPSSSCRGGAASCTKARIRRQPYSNLFAVGGGSPAITNNSCEGTRCAPYRPTPEENPLSSHHPGHIVSISAMNYYCEKSHEELKWEDSKQKRNQGPSSAANVSGISNPFQPANSSGWFPPSEPPAFAFKRSSENPFQKTGPSSAAYVSEVSNPSPNPFSVGWFPPSEPLGFTSKRSSENPFHRTGGGPAIADNSCGETCAHYQPTPAEENNLSWNNASPVLTSISAMNCYCNKSHEELRWEGYKQIRNGGPSSAANVSGVSNPLPNPVSSSSANPFQRPTNSSGWFPPCEPNPFTFNRSSENPTNRTDSSSSLGSDKNRTTPVQTSPVQSANSSGWFPPCEPPPFTFNRSSENSTHRTDFSTSLGSDKNRTTPVQTSPVQTSVAQTLPSPTPTTTTAVSNQTSNVNLTLSITASGGVSCIPSFVNCIISAFGAFDINGGRPLNSVLGTPVLGFPVLIPTTLAFIPQYPQVCNPTSALPLHQPETQSIPSTILVNTTSSASTTNPANAHLSTIAETTTSHVSPSATVLGEQITNLSTASSGSASPTDFNLPATQHSSSIPEGLEIIVDHLGFNPWEGKNHLQDSQGGRILVCEDASDDTNILSLAEFAVEQHNAMEQVSDQPDDEVELLKVKAACLEAVDGGRYHIVLEAKKAASSVIPVYAVVLWKKTNRPTPLIVLERWLHN